MSEAVRRRSERVGRIGPAPASDQAASQSNGSERSRRVLGDRLLSPVGRAMMRHCINLPRC
jgi:hypothetical protein